MKKKVCSFGVIPLKKERDTWKVLLVKHVEGGHWGFPKGHKETGESSYKAAARELKEETGLTIKRMIRKKALVERYIPNSFKDEPQKYEIHKTVYYYMAEVEGVLSLQVEEISDGRFVGLEDAESLATHVESKHLVKRVKKYLSSWWRKIWPINL